MTKTVKIPLLFVVFFLLPLYSYGAPFPKGITYKVEKYFEPKIELVSSRLEEIVRKKQMEILPANRMIRFLPVHIFAANKKMDKQIFALVGASVSRQYLGQVYEVAGGQFYHLKIKDIPLVIGFKGVEQKDANDILNFLKSGSYAYNTGFENLFLNQAHADEVTATVDPEQGAATSSFTGDLISSFEGCAYGIADGANAVLVDPFVDAGKSAYFLVTDPKGWWNASIEEGKALAEVASHPIRTAQGVYQNYNNASIQDKSRVNCSLVGTGGTGALMARSVKVAMGTAQIPKAVSGLTHSHLKMIADEARALELAKKAGFKVGNRAEVLKAIDAEIEKLSQLGVGYFSKTGVKYPHDHLVKIITDVDKGFRSNLKAGTPEWTAARNSYRLDVFRQMQGVNDTYFMQIVRPVVESQYGWTSYYQAWNQRLVTMGGRGHDGSGNGGAGTLFFSTGENGMLKVSGVSNRAAEPKAVLMAESNKSLTIVDTKVTQASRSEGATFWPLEFKATIYP